MPPEPGIWETQLMRPWNLRDDLDIFLAMENVVDDFVEDNFLEITCQHGAPHLLP